MPPKGAYTGPVCFVGQDDVAPDGRPLDAGWHYTVVEIPSVTTVDGDPATMPGEKLYLDHETGAYRYATGEDESWQARHHKRLLVVAPGGNIGQPETAEEIEAAHAHLDRLESRLGEFEPDPQEHDHILTTPDEIMHTRRWLTTLPGAKK